MEWKSDPGSVCSPRHQIDIHPRNMNEALSVASKNVLHLALDYHELHVLVTWWILRGISWRWGELYWKLMGVFSLGFFSCRCLLAECIKSVRGRGRCEGHRHVAAPTYTCTPTWQRHWLQWRHSRRACATRNDSTTMRVVADNIDGLYIMYATLSHRAVIVSIPHVCFWIPFT